ncbi:hypothetical protein TBLA_0A03100 [Henningerozyma blattae CBS 6284]|uniref:Uncharacterized protein n=1 Tax=Henningerozyma blattae (strain ATCC 34711 / CBS 6284 / DSM 70876 / NBRC 10599 / NRRL Y-10934 / UCD 77-7) TaxID=1071380 RepID=I2GVF8_HENB6|nr:hypothetical protein TBLA_0A03100 [Tetrapisispora blattae CBS 6284]CCH58110.1 hypothetical protein TBLA_0A03100 [Tetrapisispora blattae CBS 6284]
MEQETNYIFFGSTGMTGFTTLTNLLNINSYLQAKDPQSAIDNLPQDFQWQACDDSLDLYLVKNIFCINRRFFDSPIYLDEKIISSNISINYKDKTFELQFQSNTNSVSNNITEQNELKLPLVSTDCLRYFIDTGNIQLETTPGKENQILTTDEVWYHFNQQLCQLNFKQINLNENENDNDNVQEKFIKLNYIINIYQFVLPKSDTWLEVLPNIFKPTTILHSKINCTWNYIDQFTNEKSNIVLPKLEDIQVMICTLGTNLLCDQKKIDFDLTFQLSNWFSNRLGKKLVIVTAFNNSLLSKTFNYFNVKNQLEKSLKYDLDFPLGELVILRPGPLLGTHVLNPSEEQAVVLNHSTKILKQLWFYKTFFSNHKC